MHGLNKYNYCIKNNKKELSFFTPVLQKQERRCWSLQYLVQSHFLDSTLPGPAATLEPPQPLRHVHTQNNMLTKHTHAGGYIIHIQHAHVHKPLLCSEDGTFLPPSPPLPWMFHYGDWLGLFQPLSQSVLLQRVPNGQKQSVHHRILSPGGGGRAEDESVNVSQSICHIRWIIITGRLEVMYSQLRKDRNFQLPWCVKISTVPLCPTRLWALWQGAHALWSVSLQHLCHVSQVGQNLPEGITSWVIIMYRKVN